MRDTRVQCQCPSSKLVLTGCLIDDEGGNPPGLGDLFPCILLLFGQTFSHLPAQERIRGAGDRGAEDSKGVSPQL